MYVSLDSLSKVMIFDHIFIAAYSSKYLLNKKINLIKMCPLCIWFSRVTG